MIPRTMAIRAGATHQLGAMDISSASHVRSSLVASGFSAEVVHPRQVSLASPGSIRIEHKYEHRLPDRMATNLCTRVAASFPPAAARMWTCGRHEKPSVLDWNRLGPREVLNCNGSLSQVLPATSVGGSRPNCSLPAMRCGASFALRRSWTAALGVRTPALRSGEPISPTWHR